MSQRVKSDQQTPVQRRKSYRKPFQSPLLNSPITPFNVTPTSTTPFKKQKIANPEYQKLLSKKDSLQTKVKQLENQKRILELVHRYSEKNEIETMDQLIQKWKRAGREALEDLRDKNDEHWTCEQLAQKLGFEVNVLGDYDLIDDCFI